jgi:hypothetical protein
VLSILAQALKEEAKMNILTMVLLTALVSVSTVVVLATIFCVWLRKRLHVESLTSLVLDMVHQFRIDNTNREYKFIQEQARARVEAHEAHLVRLAKAR